MKNIGDVFWKATYHLNMSESPQNLGEPQPPLELPLPPGAQLIPLPEPANLEIPAIDLRAAIEQRRSVRRYSAEPLSLQELSALLWLTQGVKTITDRPATLRTVPSAGARHAFETLLLVNNVGGLGRGLYRFAASQHSLLNLDAGETIHAEIAEACYNQKQVVNSAVLFLWLAVVERMAWRYVERSYRYMLLDAGHVCQNLYLAGEALQCGVCAIGGYNDPAINQALGLDEDNRFVIYIASVGKPDREANKPG